MCIDISAEMDRWQNPMLSAGPRSSSTSCTAGVGKMFQVLPRRDTAARLAGQAGLSEADGVVTYFGTFVGIFAAMAAMEACLEVAPALQ